MLKFDNEKEQARLKLTKRLTKEAMKESINEAFGGSPPPPENDDENDGDFTDISEDDIL